MNEDTPYGNLEGIINCAEENGYRLVQSPISEIPEKKDNKMNDEEEEEAEIEKYFNELKTPDEGIKLYYSCKEHGTGYTKIGIKIDENNKTCLIGWKYHWVYLSTRSNDPIVGNMKGRIISKKDGIFELEMEEYREKILIDFTKNGPYVEDTDRMQTGNAANPIFDSDTEDALYIRSGGKCLYKVVGQFHAVLIPSKNRPNTKFLSKIPHHYVNQPLFDVYSQISEFCQVSPDYVPVFQKKARLTKMMYINTVMGLIGEAVVFSNEEMDQESKRIDYNVEQFQGTGYPQDINAVLYPGLLEWVNQKCQDFVF